MCSALNGRLAKVKVLFLDIDGVLNSDAWFDLLNRSDPDHAPDHVFRLDPICVARVQVILTRTRAQVVLSSSWKKLPNNQAQRSIWRAGGRFRIMDKTPRLGYPRGNEIHAWLSCHPDVTRFVILDDHDDMSPYMRRLVQTDPRVGITDHDVVRALRLFRD